MRADHPTLRRPEIVVLGPNGRFAPKKGARKLRFCPFFVLGGLVQVLDLDPVAPVPL
jgi:hypothetical protein